MLAERLRFQAGACEYLGSPLYAGLLTRAADEVVSGDVVYGVLRGHEDDPAASALALRLMGAVHRLVLTGEAPGPAAHDPWPPFLEILREHRDVLRELVERPVQTNETARCAALLGGFLEVARMTAQPLRLLEVGASAGLNLAFDRYRYELGDERWGPENSPVTIRAALTGRPPLETPLEVASRAGCDARPLDPRSEDDRLTLTSYVWMDQPERLARLRAALDVSAGAGIEVERAGAADWVEAQLREEAPGVTTVVFHPIVKQYLPDDELRRFEAAVQAARGSVAWLRMEPADHLTDVRLTLFPGGEERLLARAGYHGDPVEWRSPT
jgi:hypothetical protein